MQIAAMPRFALLRFRRFSRCRTMRAPEAPTGWPSAIAPPSTFSFLLVERPERSVEAELVAAVGSSCHAARQPSTCAANASLISQ